MEKKDIQNNSQASLQKPQSTSLESLLPPSEGGKCTNLDYLRQITKNNSAGIIEIIEVYLSETLQLINTMKQAIDTKDWESLRMAAHSIAPSFSMIGIDTEFEDNVSKIQEYAFLLQSKKDSGRQTKKEQLDVIQELFLKTETICAQAYEELQKELLVLKMH